jgi:uncharacterized protein YceK
MSFIPLPYRYRPRRRDRMSLADKILAAILIFFAAVCLLPSAGCATYATRCASFDAYADSVYPATHTDFYLFGSALGDGGVYVPLLGIFAVVDLPFSLATDTLLLPYDVIKNNTTKGDTP